MNALTQRIYLREKDLASTKTRKFNIFDVLGNNKIGRIKLKSNQLKSIKVNSKSQNKYVATEALLMLLQRLEQDIECQVPENNIPAIKLFSTFSKPQTFNASHVFNFENNITKHQSWHDIYLKKLVTSGYITNNSPFHKLINPASGLILIGKDMFDRDCYLHPTAMKYWKKMTKKANKEGIDLQIISAFRGLDYQNQLIQNKINKGQLLEDILKVNTLAGYSEHHSGRAIDIGSKGAAILETEFENSEAFIWLMNNASKYNFELSYPRNNDSGIIYEPWHWCYQQPKFDTPTSS